MKEKIKEKYQKTKAFVIKHKKKIAIGTGIVSAIIGAIAVVAHSKSNSSNSLNYTKSFFKNATDDQLKFERERVRQEWASAGLNNISDAEESRLFNLLHYFDKVISDRAWAGQEKGYPVHSEHGWHLPSDD